MSSNVIERSGSDDEVDIVQEIARNKKKKEKEPINEKAAIETHINETAEQETCPTAAIKPKRTRNRDVEKLPGKLISNSRQQMRAIAKEKLALTIERERLEADELRKQVEAMRSKVYDKHAEEPKPVPIAKIQSEARTKALKVEPEEDDIVEPPKKRIPPVQQAPTQQQQQQQQIPIQARKIPTSLFSIPKLMPNVRVHNPQVSINHPVPPTPYQKRLPTGIGLMFVD